MQITKVESVQRMLSSDPDFPSSAGSTRNQINATVNGSALTYGLISELMGIANQNGQVPSIQNIEIFPQTDASLRLRSHFDFYGSDKGSFHEYDLIYTQILDFLGRKSLSILEIGLGTNNTKVMSHMGAHGRPGASLRAWRASVPEAKIIGCDIDPGALFQEENIQTYELDQTSTTSWRSFKSQIRGETFDLIIDDGLHAPYANLKTLTEALPLLKANGIFVVEDIAIQSLPIWNIVAAHIDAKWSCQIYKTKHAFMAVFWGSHIRTNSTQT